MPDLLDRRATTEFFGGTKPLHAATLYRGIRAGRYPRPVKVGALSRWLRSECEAAIGRGSVEAFACLSPYSPVRSRRHGGAYEHE